MFKIRLLKSRISRAFLLCLFGTIAIVIYGSQFALAETARFSLNVTDTVLEISLSTNAVSIDLAPVNGSAAFNSGSVNINVGTNNSTGYYLTMSSTNTSIPRNAALSGGSTPSIAPIPSITGGYSDSTFASSSDTINKWGYKTSGNYFPFLTSDIYVNATNAPANTSSNTVTFGAKVDDTQPAGTYSTSISFTAVANPEQIYYMQDVATWENIANVYELEVIDSRTGFSYLITKEDDTLVMLDDLKIPAGTTLTPSDSDVSVNFTLPTEEWTSSSQDYYCKPIMKVVDGEYFYNWYAATANPTSCTDPTASTNASHANDANSLGSICPAGWTLPTNQNATIFTGSDMSITWYYPAPGYVVSGVYSEGVNGDPYRPTYIGYYWLSTRKDNEDAYSLRYDHITYAMAQTASIVGAGKYIGGRVRCIRETQSTNQLVFKTGDGIETIIVADSSNNYAPVYATPGSPAIISNPSAGTEFVVTVVPRPGYILDEWEGDDTSAFSDGTLLTTTYEATGDPDILTAIGTHGSYESMQNDILYVSDCAGGVNVTDIRDGKSYTVTKIGNYCYMLSNLRLDAGITLTSGKSDITPTSNYSSFTTPTTTWSNHYCEARMKVINGEYYYNWYAAKANPTTGLTSSSSCATATYDNASLGSICPAGWTLPTYDDLTPALIWGSGNNPGMLSKTGIYYGTAQHTVGSAGVWWSRTRSSSSDGLSNNLIFNANGVSFDAQSKYRGLSVRCMLKR